MLLTKEIISFSGEVDDHVSIYIEDLEAHGRILGYSASQLCDAVIITTTGRARLWLHNWRTTTSTIDWPHLKSALTSAFAPPNKWIQLEKIGNCKQEHHQTVAEFSERFTHIAWQIQATESQMLDHFILNLRPEIRIHVCKDNPGSFEKAKCSAL